MGVRGTLTRENGLRDRGGVGSGAGRVLRPLASPISGLVDRGLCSEFQLISAVVDILYRSSEGRHPGEVFRGCVRLFVSTAPCVSCIWALRQFQLLLPHVRVEVGNGEELYLQRSDF